MVVDGFRSTIGEGERVVQSRELKISFSSLLGFFFLVSVISLRSPIHFSRNFEIFRETLLKTLVALLKALI